MCGAGVVEWEKEGELAMNPVNVVPDSQIVGSKRGCSTENVKT